MRGEETGKRPKQANCVFSVLSNLVKKSPLYFEKVGPKMDSIKLYQMKALWLVRWSNRREETERPSPHPPKSAHEQGCSYIAKP